MPAAASRAARRARAVESFGAASDCIGPIEKDMALFAITRGQWSMIDAINHCVDQLGSAHASIWTWAIADYEVEVVQAMIADRRLMSASLICDASSAQGRNAATVDAWRDRFGPDSVRMVRTHAKIARVWNDDYRLLLRGSMNLNFNPRFEQFDITEGGPDFDLVESMEAEIPILPGHASHADVDAASKLSRSWEASTLEMFGKTKVWAK
jgi:hypothetical protein